MPAAVARSTDVVVAPAGAGRRGRHARRRRSVWAWLVPAPSAPPQPSWRTVHAHSLVLLCDDVARLQGELLHLRTATEQSTAAAVIAELRALRLEEQLTATRAELAVLRDELSALREELVWTFTSSRAPGDRGARAELPRVAGTA